MRQQLRQVKTQRQNSVFFLLTETLMHHKSGRIAQRISNTTHFTDIRFSVNKKTLIARLVKSPLLKRWGMLDPWKYMSVNITNFSLVDYTLCFT